MPPWSTSLPAQVAAVEALNDEDYYERCYRKTHLRQELASALCRDPKLHVYVSNIDVVLLKVPVSAQAIVERIRECDIYVRNCDSMSKRFHDRFIQV